MQGQHMRSESVWIILRSNIAYLPPVTSLIDAILSHTGFDVHFVSSARVEQFDSPRFYQHIYAPSKVVKALGKPGLYIGFRKFAESVLAASSKGDQIWLASMDTALSLIGSRTLSKNKFTLQLHELYDSHPFRLKLIAKVARTARAVVVPERNRAAILRVWLGLAEVPHVLPNKPFRHPRQRRIQPSTPEVAQLIADNYSGRNVVLYQGHISGDRDLRPLVNAISSLDNVELWLLGKDHGYVDELKQMSDRVRYLGYVSPPHHLEITSYADVGVMNYDPVSLNNIFCAPNKIWEYSGFGIPFLGNSSPSLDWVVGTFRSGVTCSFDAASITEKLDLLLSEKDRYVENARDFFDSVDFGSVVSELLYSVQKKPGAPE